MDKGLAGEVGHSGGHLATVAQEGVVVHINDTFLFRSEAKKVLPEISLQQQLEGNQYL